jgi:hypothetical protein
MASLRLITIIAAALLLAIIPPAIVYSTYPETADVYIKAYYPDYAEKPGFVVGIWGCRALRGGSYKVAGVLYVAHGLMGYVETPGGDTIAVVLHGCWSSRLGEGISGTRLAGIANGKPVVVVGEAYKTPHGTVLVPVRIDVAGKTFHRVDWGRCGHRHGPMGPMHGHMGCCG